MAKRLPPASPSTGVSSGLLLLLSPLVAPVPWHPALRFGLPARARAEAVRPCACRPPPPAGLAGPRERCTRRRVARSGSGSWSRRGLLVDGAAAAAALSLVSSASVLLAPWPSRASPAPPESILDEVADLVQRYYIYAQEGVGLEEAARRRFDIDAWLQKKQSLDPLARKSPEDARRAAARLMRGGFDRYSKYLPPEALAARTRRFAPGSAGGVPLDRAQDRIGILTGTAGTASGTPTSTPAQSEGGGAERSSSSGVRVLTARRRAGGGIPHRSGTLRIPSFVGGTARDVREGLTRLRDAGVDEIILDLRHNKGGNLQEGLDTASLLLPPGTRIARLADAVASRWQWSPWPSPASGGGGGATLGVPVVVLVDGSTASAAEMLAASLRDNCGGMIVGRWTYGKAAVQSVFKLSDGSGLQLTVGFYRTPNGNSIQDVGLRPDVGSELPADWIVPSLDTMTRRWRAQCDLVRD